MPESRLELREASAKAVNALSRERLLNDFAISRVAELTGLDTTGIPVYAAVRALSNSVAIHVGKAVTREAARAGAIIEAIELEVAEHPPLSQFKVASAIQLPAEDRIDLTDCFPTRSSTVNEMTLLAWEEVTNIQNGAPKWVPSDLIWMVLRMDQALLHFQMGSNGLASGATLEDAILSGLYEIIERDGFTLHQYLMETHGVLPDRTPLVNLPAPLEILVRRLEEYQIKLHLFDCTSDYRVPVFHAMLLDLSGQSAGTFAGYGAHLNAEAAATRAVLEAVQSRVCYISGARDDILRRQFLMMKRMDQIKLDAAFNDLAVGSALPEYRKLDFPDVKSELRYLLKLIKGHGVSEVYVKDMGAHVDGAIHVAKVFSPQCEPYRFDFWAPTLRCLSYAERKIKEMKQLKEDEWRA
jgi:YcaO-like protein with predicted kinase domain